MDEETRICPNCGRHVTGRADTLEYFRETGRLMLRADEDCPFGNTNTADDTEF